MRERIYYSALIILWAFILLLAVSKPVPAAEIERREAHVIEADVETVSAPADVPEEPEVLDMNPYREIIENLSEADFLLLGQAVYREAEISTHECRAGVVITIINRVMSPEWPDSISEVLYQPGQFATARMLKGTTPTQADLDAINEVRKTGNRVLQEAIDDAGYTYDAAEIVYFSTDHRKQSKYARDFVRVGGHDYGRAK